MNFSEHLLFPTEQAAKSMASSNTSSKKEEEKLKAEGKLFKLGQGLDEETRSKLFTEYHLHANAGDGTTIRTKVTAGDGYDETARLSVEMVLLLTTKRDSLPFEGGVLTPSVAGGRPFLDAIRSSGIAFEVLDDDLQGRLREGQGASGVRRIVRARWRRPRRRRPHDAFCRLSLPRQL